MLKIGMDVEFEGERAEVMAESADHRLVWLESPSHPYPGVEVESDRPLRVLSCPTCGHREPYEPPLSQERADAIEQATIRDSDQRGAPAEPAFGALWSAAAAKVVRSGPAGGPLGG